MRSRRLLECVFTFIILFSGFRATGQVTGTDTAQEDGPVIVQQQKDDPLPLPPPPGTKAHLYRMNYWVSGGFSLAATGANIWAIPNLIKAKPDITPGELAGLNKDAYNQFEQWAFKHDPMKADRFDKSSDMILQATVVAPALLGLNKNIRKDALRLFVMYYETHAITFSLYNFSFFGPSFQNKYRPYVYYTEIPADDRDAGNNKNSMYSGHTASAAAATFFMAKVYNDYHPEFSFGRKYLMYGLASIPPLVQGYYRLKALKHFPSDILIGFLLGATTGIAVPEMHRFKNQAIKLSLVGTPAGPGLCLNWTPKEKVARMSQIGL
jgi:membrane-associated phospholipid phosphatase